MAISAEVRCKNMDVVPESVVDELLKIGVPVNVDGFPYLATTLTLVVRDPSKVNSMVKGLYTEVAEMYESTPSRVNKAISSAIRSSWSKGNIKYQHQLFGSSVSSITGSPTNLEFIMRVSDNLRKLEKLRKLVVSGESGS